MTKTLFDLEKIFGIKLDTEYTDLLIDIYKYTIIYAIIAILASCSNSQLSNLILNGLKELLLFPTIALCAYHLVLKHLVKF
jgi:hypothetical protein